MKPLPATADVLQSLAAMGDERIRTTVGWICETVLEVVPLADALSITFIDEDLTLALVRPATGGPTSGAAQPAMRSSLELTFATHARITTVIAVYSERAGAFDHRVGVVEHVLGAVPGTAVLDGDLAFDSARRAGLAPAQLDAWLVLDTAVGMLMDSRGLTIDQAEDWLDREARRTGRSDVQVAAQVLASRQHRPPTTIGSLDGRE